MTFAHFTMAVAVLIRNMNLLGMITERTFLRTPISRHIEYNRINTTCFLQTYRTNQNYYKSGKPSYSSNNLEHTL